MASEAIIEQTVNQRSLFASLFASKINFLMQTKRMSERKGVTGRTWGTGKKARQIRDKGSIQAKGFSQKVIYAALKVLKDDGSELPGKVNSERRSRRVFHG